MALFFYKEKNKDIRAAAYLRLSIEDGDKAESNSIGNQRELIRDFELCRHIQGTFDFGLGRNFFPEIQVENAECQQFGISQ